MSNKSIKIYFLKIIKSHSLTLKREAVSPAELDKLFLNIQQLPLTLTNIPTRYANPGTGTENCIIFSQDKCGLNIPEKEYFISGLFIKRRNAGYPYEEDGTGNLAELKLIKEQNEIAEVTYFIIDKRNGVLSWVNNKFCGSSNTFITYLNSKFEEITSGNVAVEPLLVDNEAAQLEAFFIANPDSYDEFVKNMKRIRQLEFKIAMNANDSENYYLDSHKGNTNEIMIGLLEAMQQSNCHSLRLELSMGHSKKRDISKDFVKRIFAWLCQDDKNLAEEFIVRGSIDEQSRTLDLISDKFLYQASLNYRDKYVPSLQVFEQLFSAYFQYRPSIEEYI